MKTQKRTLFEVWKEKKLWKVQLPKGILEFCIKSQAIEQAEHWKKRYLKEINKNKPHLIK